jgi:chaperonin GroES
MAKKLIPLSDRVIVRRASEEETTRGGIILADTAKEKPQEGIVLAVGPGRVENGVRVAMSVSEGQRVLFGKYAGTELTVDGEELLVVREEELLTAIEETTEPAETTQP